MTSLIFMVSAILFGSGEVFGKQIYCISNSTSPISTDFLEEYCLHEGYVVLPYLDSLPSINYDGWAAYAFSEVYMM